MRMYIIAGPIGSGITEVARELWEELFSKGLRTVRKVYGRPDEVSNPPMSEAEIIAAIEADIINNVNTVDFLISGSEVNRHLLAIKRHWQAESKVVFVRKQDEVRAIEAGLSLLEHHVNFNKTEFTVYMQEQIKFVNDAAVALSVEWKDVLVLDMFEFNADKLSETDTMTNETFSIKEYTGTKSNDCVPRQLALSQT